MLTRLRVNNLALVEDITLEFEPGLNVLTGETGAGKSVLIGALGLLSGQRSDRSAIRDGKNTASVEAEFYLEDDTAVQSLLKDIGLLPIEEKQLLLRRVLKTQGTSTCTVNDQSVTTQTLKRLGTLLLDMHGPHDHQSLFHPRAQTEILDAFGRHEEALAEYQDAFHALRKTQAEIERLQNKADDSDAQIDLLRYRVQELEEARLDPDEESRIEQEHEIAGHAMEILEGVAALNQLLIEGDPGMFDLLSQAQAPLHRLARVFPTAEAWLRQLQEMAGQIQELNREIEFESSRLDADPQRLAELDQRLSVYQKLKRKYRRTVPELLAWQEESRQQLHALEHRDEVLENLRNTEQQQRTETLRHGKTLHAMRMKSGTRLSKAITAEIQALGFAQGDFKINVETSDPGSLGLDKVDFAFAPNPGESMRPLRQIASSGEISRVMLAVKAVLARHDQIPVLVFDEIDANIGGEVGSAVGQKLREVSKFHQVLCITHLPQVAVYGQHHFAISKSVREGRTFTEAKALLEDERVEEVARMLGGRNLTDVTLDHARKMLERSP